MIDWSKSTWTKEDHKKALQVLRAADSIDGIELDHLAVWMDLEACNIACPLDLDKLLSFDEFNLLHDLGGISRNLNRATGELENGFTPRCAA